MRQPRLCCFAFRDTDYLTAEDIAVAGRLRTRYMFRNERVRTCAALLDRGRLQGDSTAFILSLSKALFAAVLQLADGEPSKIAALTRANWDAVSRHIRDNLGGPLTVATPAPNAQMPPPRFGRAFTDP